MLRRVLLRIALGAVLVGLAIGGASRWGFSDRVERHMFPQVTTGPETPSWSRDGRIAFAARGDIWTVPADGGDATAVTQGPGYYFEPSWSPDGSRIAATTVDANSKLGIAVIDVATGKADAVDTGSSGVALEPTWSHDGNSVLYTGVASGRGGTAIFRHDLKSGANERVVAGFEAAVSPDGTQLAYMATVPGQIGTGGIWVRPLSGPLSSDPQPRLVRYEQSEYRMRPNWTPDGQEILYVSDEAGSNDVRMVAATGGEPVQLTADAGDEFAPTVSPDGKQFAFVSNRAGSTVLYTLNIGGGPFPSWRAVPIRNWHARLPVGHVQLRVLDTQQHATPADVFVIASDGRAYFPAGAFAREIAASGRLYFETGGSSEIEVPAGKVAIEATKGFEYKPTTVTVDVPEGGSRPATVALTRLADLPARGWYSGDPHIHDLHQGNFGLSHEVFFNELMAADIHVTSALIHMDGTRLMGRWSDLTGQPSPLSRPDYILQYAEEFRGSLGHMELLGIQHFILPFDAGERGTPYAQPTLDSQYADAAHAQGGIAGYPHPYFSAPTTPEAAGGTLIATDAALGKGDFYDVASLYSDEIGSAGFYDKLLNCGFHLPASGGTDNFSDVSRDPPPGADRAYVHVRGPLTYGSWLQGLKAGHSFGSTGPLLTLDVEGHEPGDTLQLAAGAPATVHVRADALSIANLTEMDILVNGVVAQAIKPGDPLHLTFDGQINVPQGGWVGLRAQGPTSRYVGDSYAFAESTPVFVVRGGRQWISAADANFMAQTVEATWTRVQNSTWRSDAERDAFHAEIERARDVYLKLAAQASQP